MNTQLVRNFGVALLTAASIFAQGSPNLTVQIPFGFHVGSTILPSGEYTVYTSAAQGVVRLRSADSKSSVIILSNAVMTQKTPTQGKLVFNRYGEEYFLSQIWGRGSNTGHELRKTRREIETAVNVRREVESMLARR